MLQCIPQDRRISVSICYQAPQEELFAEIRKKGWQYHKVNSEVKDEFKAKGIQEAKEDLDILKLSLEERLDFEAFIKDWRISKNEIKTAKMEGIDEEKTNVVLRSYRKGFAAPDFLDIAEVTLPQLAQILLKAGESLDKIAADTGLRLEEIGE